MKKIFITLGIVFVTLTGGDILVKNTIIDIIDQRLNELTKIDEEEQLFQTPNKEELLQQMIDEMNWEVETQGLTTIIFGYFTNTIDFTINVLSLYGDLIESATGARVKTFTATLPPIIRPNDTVLIEFRIPLTVDFSKFNFEVRVKNVTITDENFYAPFNW